MPPAPRAELPRVVLEMESSELRARVATSLAQLGVKIAEGTLSELDIRFIFGALPESSDADAARTVHLWSGMRKRPLTNPFASRQVRHVLASRPGLDPAELMSTLEHIGAGRHISFEEVLDNKIADRLTLQATRSDQKAQVIDALAQFLSTHAARPQLRDAVLLALDELYTNAVYNAPTDGKRRLFAATSRTQVVESPRPMTIDFGVSSEFIAIALRDEYGSLQPEVVVDSLFRCFRSVRAEVEEKDGGAGLGFFLLLQQSNRLVINIDPGTSTQIILMRRRNESGRQFALSCPSLNLCVEGGTSVYERRRQRRHTIRWRGLCAARSAVREVEICDVSTGGAFLSGRDQETMELHVGETVLLRLHPPWMGSAVEVRAVVRWQGRSRVHRRDGVGIQFESELAGLERALSLSTTSN